MLMINANPIHIGEQLWFEETQLGSTLNFHFADIPGGILFKVGISYESLMECSKALDKLFSAWSIRDGSLALYGDREQLSLHFSAVDGSNLYADHVLRGRELRAFRYAISALAQREGFQRN